MPRFSEDPRVLTTDQIMESATGGPRKCLFCCRSVGEFHRPGCVARPLKPKPKPRRFVAREVW